MNLSVISDTRPKPDRISSFSLNHASGVGDGLHSCRPLRSPIPEALLRPPFMIQDPISRFQNYSLTIQHILREWVPYLKPTESLVVLFIADRTAGWGKEAEEITHRHFLQGIRDRKTAAVYAGALPLTRPTLTLVLGRLTCLGAIRSVKKNKRTAYSINLDWNPYPTTETMALAKPKRLKELQSLQTTERQNTAKKGKEICPLDGKEICPSMGKEIFPYKKNKEKKGKIEEANPSDSRRAEPEEGELDHALSHAKRRAVSRRESKVSAWSALSASVAWSDLCRSHLPPADRLAVTVADSSVLHKYGKRWMAARGGSVADWLEYLGWVVARWQAIRAQHFAWMKEAPVTVPSIRFMVKLSDRFEQAWVARATIERTAAMTPREREVERLLQKGVDREVAERDVDAKLGLTKEREAMERAAANLRRQREGIQRDAATISEAEVRNDRWKRLRKSSLDLSEGTNDTWK